MESTNATTIDIEWFGRNRHSALIFAEYAEHINREVGIDVYEKKAQWEADLPIVRDLINKYRKDGTFPEDFLDDVWQEYLQQGGILTKEEQQAKDEFTLAKARTTKRELRDSAMSDAPRFGYCKRSGCSNRKVERLLIRGFCPDCRGVRVKQSIAEGGRFSATAPYMIDATALEMETSVTASKNPKFTHADTLTLTTEERNAKVLAVKQANPSASIRDVAKLTKIPRSVVGRIVQKQSLSNQLVESTC